MLSAQLIRRFLLTRLSRALAAFTRVAALSALRLRNLLFYFRLFVTKFHGLLRYSSAVSKSVESDSESYPVLASPSTGWCPQSLPPLLPSHTEAIVATVAAANSVQAVVPPSPPHTIPDRESLHEHVVISNGSRIQFEFTPLNANNTLRYENRLPAKKNVRYKGIPTLTRKFSNEMNDVAWQPCVHPEGALYFCNNSRRSFTEGNRDKTQFDMLDGCVNTLYTLLAKSTKVEDDNIELFLQVSQDNDSWSCQYYFVDHANRTLFWLQDYVEATDDIFSGLRGVYNLSHIAYALEFEYWTHCERYPHHKLDRVKLLKELRELAMYTRAEVITSDTSLSPFAADELSSILDLVSHLEVNAKDDEFPHSICVIARFMHYFSRAKFFNFCGLPCARLDADESVYGEGDSSFHPLTDTFAFVLDAVLFWAPQAHYKELRRVWVDDCIVAPRWKDFSRNLMSEWNGITIYSTVMLAVDVSFLAVPNVNIQQSQSVGIVATYLSTIFITGSLISSLLLARQTQRYGPESAEGATQLLSKMTGTLFGKRALATIHSLPYAMLLWGMIFFVISFLYNVFKSYTKAMFVSVVSGSVLVVISILWFIWTAREVHIFRQLAQYVRELPTHVAEFIGRES